jgi:tRNA pseudouridine38-40 synthase
VKAEPLNRAPRVLKLTLQYDGTDFVGWQRQPRGASVQGLLEDALAAFEGTAVTVHGAGRTDAGVHALAQVASVSLSVAHDVTTLHRALNAVLPAAVRILSVEEASPEFHARFSAVGKTYEYRIVNAAFVSPFLQRYVWHIPQPLNVDAMKAAALTLTGTHDFAAFQGSGSLVHTTVRTIHTLEWNDGSDYARPLRLTLGGDGFLRHMVRNIVGTLVEIGLGRWAPADMAGILASRDRSRAGTTAPPHGLFLARVLY